MAYIGKEPIVGNFQVCDAITVVNGQAAYTLQVSSTNVVPESANHMLVSLNGILQAPVTSFTVSGSTLTFASNLATGDVIDFVILLGNVLDLGTVSDGTITNAKLAQDIISGETALTVPPATTDEILLSDAGTLKRLDVSLIGNGPAFAAYRNYDDGGYQSISNNTVTKVAFTHEYFDTHSAYDNSSNYRFTIPANQGGKYIIGTHNVIDNVADQKWTINYIYKNGSAYKASLQASSGGFPTGNGIQFAIDASATDYFEAYVKHLDGSTSDLRTEYGNIFYGFKLSGV